MLSLFPRSCVANTIQRRTRPCVEPHSIQLLPHRRGKVSCRRQPPDNRPAISPVLAAAAFAQHISYGPVMYENLLLSQTAEPQSYRCLSAPKLGRSDGCCALVTLSRLAHWFERARWSFNSVPQHFSDPLALTFWGDTGGACGGMQVRMDDMPRWL